MKTFIALLAFGLLAGCSTSWIEAEGVRAHNTRWFWASTDFTAELPTTNGVFKVSLKTSNTQTDAIAAAAEGVVRGLKP